MLRYFQIFHRRTRPQFSQMDQWRGLTSPRSCKSKRKNTQVVAACTSPFWTSEAVAQTVLDPTVPAVMHPQRLYEKPNIATFVGNPTDVNPNRSSKALQILKRKHMIDLGPGHDRSQPAALPNCVQRHPAVEAYMRRGSLITPRTPDDMAHDLPLPPSSRTNSRSPSVYHTGGGIPLQGIRGFRKDVPQYIHSADPEYLPSH